MSGIVVLGGAGGIGRVAARALAHVDGLEEVVVADARLAEAEAVVRDLGDDRFSAASVDVTVPAQLRELIDGHAVVLNCVGPFYRFGPPTLATVIEAGVGYVDICDDLDATEAMLSMDDEAARAGVLALIGVGNSPGLANIFVKLCAEQLLEEVTGAEVMHIHGGEPDEGPAVLKHRIHAMVSDVPAVLDGQPTIVRMLEESGARLVHEEEFPALGPYPVYPYPHPETITLPRTFPTLRNVTNLGVVFPLSYFQMTSDLVRAGMASEEPVEVAGCQVAPIDVMVAMLRRERPRLLAEAGVEGPAGCLRVVVEGKIAGVAHTFTCTLSSTSEGAGEGTGIPAALGAALGARGQLEGGPGVHPPEVAVPVDAMLSLASRVLASMADAGGRALPLLIEHTAPDGSRSEVPLQLG